MLSEYFPVHIPCSYCLVFGIATSSVTIQERPVNTLHRVPTLITSFHVAFFNTMALNEWERKLHMNNVLSEKKAN